MMNVVQTSRIRLDASCRGHRNGATSGSRVDPLFSPATLPDHAREKVL